MDMREYTQGALRTAAANPFFDKVPASVFQAVLEDRLMEAPTIDQAKKTLFYGKAPGDELRTLMVCLDPKDLPNATYNSVSVNTLHAILGLATEVDELVSLLKTAVATGKPIDRAELINESGDLMWYLAVLFDDLNTTHAEVGEKNLAKLRARFPEKFSAELAINKVEANENHVFQQTA